jgi:hypothetical protein
MNRSFGNIGITVILSAVGSVALLDWLVNDDATKLFVSPVVNEYKQAGISKLDIEYKNNVILLNVTLSKPMSCNKIFEALDIGDLPLKGKVYSPVCTTVNPSLIVITYKEKVTA